MDSSTKEIVCNFLARDCAQFLVRKGRVRIDKYEYNQVNNSLVISCQFGITSIYYIIYPYNTRIPETITWSIVSLLEENLLISLYGLINRFLIPYQEKLYLECYTFLMTSYPVLEKEFAEGAKWPCVLVESGSMLFKSEPWLARVDLRD